jgi:hypothetical protein
LPGLPRIPGPFGAWPFRTLCPFRVFLLGTGRVATEVLSGVLETSVPLRSCALALVRVGARRVHLDCVTDIQYSLKGPDELSPSLGAQRLAFRR